MAKEQIIIKLVGKLTDGSAAKTHQAGVVTGFSDVDGQFRLWPVPDDMLLSGDYFLQTAKGRYTLKKHATLDMYQGEVNGCKIHFTHKKIVGKLIYWF